MSLCNLSPLQRAIADHDGCLEVSAGWVSASRGGFRLVDVREPPELAGPLGAIPSVPNIPLLELLSTVDRFEHDEPVVVVDRSGRRSARAADALRQAGVPSIAAMEGGMIAWSVDVLGRSDLLWQEGVSGATTLADAIFRGHGLAEVAAGWVAQHRHQVRLIDLRTPAEVRVGGRVAGAELRSVDALLSMARDLPRDQPLALLCASGGRSARLVLDLERAGFSCVVSVEAGLYGWKAYGLPVL